MAIQFRCSGCGKLLSAKDEHAGRKAKCPACGQLNVIPGTSDEETPVASSDAGGVLFCEVPCRCGRVLRLTPEQLQRGVICAQCGRRVPQPEAPEAEAAPAGVSHKQPPELPQGFAATIRDAFTYPLQNRALLAIAIIGGAYFVIAFISPFLICLLWLVRLVLLICAHGYAASYFLSALAASAMGEREPPQLPDVRDISSSILYPFALFAATRVFSYLPAIIYVIAASAHSALSQYLNVMIIASMTLGSTGAMPLQFVRFLAYPFLALLALGSFIFPMALMRVGGLYSLRGLSPLPIVVSIFRVPLQYLGLVLLLLLAIAVPLLGGFALGAIPLVAPCFGMLLAPIFSLYAMLVEMRLMGLFVAKYQERLKWTDLEPLTADR